MTKKTNHKVKNAKAKGSGFERDVLHNLQRTYPHMYLTSKQGFVQQYDLCDDEEKVVVECKRHKSISWNQAKKWFEKLERVAPEGYECLLVFKSNQQPVLVMKRPLDIGFMAFEFEQDYGVFEKHPPVKKKTR